MIVSVCGDDSESHSVSRREKITMDKPHRGVLEQEVVLGLGLDEEYYLNSLRRSIPEKGMRKAKTAGKKQQIELGTSEGKPQMGRIYEI